MDLKGCYSKATDSESKATDSESKQKPLTAEVLKEAIAKMQSLQSIPEIWYSKYLPPDHVYKFINSFRYYIINHYPERVFFVGKNAAGRLIEKGIEIQNFRKEDMDFIEIDLEVVHTTQDAFLLSDGDKEEWFPVSTILANPSKRWYDYEKGDTETFEIAQWKLEDVGFL